MFELALDYTGHMMGNSGYLMLRRCLERQEVTMVTLARERTLQPPYALSLSVEVEQLARPPRLPALEFVPSNRDFATNSVVGRAIQPINTQRLNPDSIKKRESKRASARR
ncbi:hypothetical protein FRC14_001280 [Serendipita sp. 396]|nr:hypothetical protein FRC14_001280 [Serendipita sp. 396]